jgi:hypothetical protein
MDCLLVAGLFGNQNVSDTHILALHPPTVACSVYFAPPTDQSGDISFLAGMVIAEPLQSNKIRSAGFGRDVIASYQPGL